MYQKNLKNYKATQILTADPGRIILMLYEAAIANLDHAASLAREKKFEARAKKIAHTNDIILELLASLDFETGGEIAKNLCNIYTFLVQELLRADARNDAQTIQKCRQVLATLNEAWSEIAHNGTDAAPQRPLRQYNYSVTA